MHEHRQTRRPAGFIAIQLGMLKNNHILQSENSVAVNPAAGSSDAAQILHLPLIMS